MDRIRQQRAREKAQRDALYARIDREANRRVATRDVPLPKARPKAAPKAKPAPRPPPAPLADRPARLAALFQRILADMSAPSQRKVYINAQELIRSVPAFRGLQAPSTAEVRAALAANPRFQAKFPVPEFPGRAQYGTRPLEILGADLIEKDKT